MTRRTPTVTVTASGDAPSTPVVVADVSAEGGWSLRITRADESYGAVLAGPAFGDGIEVRFWKSLPDVMETIDWYLRRRGLDDVLATFRAGVAAKVPS